MSLRRACSLPFTAWILAVVTAVGGSYGTAFAQGKPEPTRAALAVWDTGKPSAEALEPEVLESKSGWTLVATGDTARVFQGDMVIANRCLLGVARKRGTGVELYSLGSG